MSLLPRRALWDKAFFSVPRLRAGLLTKGLIPERDALVEPGNGGKGFFLSVGIHLRFTLLHSGSRESLRIQHQRRRIY
jgi:hypothetical protein